MPTRAVNDLERIRTDAAKRLSSTDFRHLLICGGTGCHATGSLKLKDALIAELEMGYTPEAAVGEAERCLQCGLICYQQTQTPEVRKELSAA